MANIETGKQYGFYTKETIKKEVKENTLVEIASGKVKRQDNDSIMLETGVILNNDKWDVAIELPAEDKK